MRKYLLMILVIVTGIFLLFQRAIASQENKMNICHATGSQSNPFVAVQIDVSAWDAHQDHGDFVYNGELKVNGHPKDKDWCNNNIPQPPEDPTPPPPPSEETPPPYTPPLTDEELEEAEKQLERIGGK